jgi:hypothetical protein
MILDIFIGVFAVVGWVAFCNWLCYSDTTNDWLNRYNSRKGAK